MNCKKILIHDAARPSPPKSLISKTIRLLKKNHAVIPIIKVNDATINSINVRFRFTINNVDEIKIKITRSLIMLKNVSI